jgi:hypothetical protein
MIGGDERMARGLYKNGDKIIFERDRWEIISQSRREDGFYYEIAKGDERKVVRQDQIQRDRFPPEDSNRSDVKAAMESVASLAAAIQHAGGSMVIDPEMPLADLAVILGRNKIVFTYVGGPRP